MRPSLCLAYTLLASAVFAAPPASSVQTTRTRLSFEPNLGQTGPLVRYFARTGSGTVFFTDRAVVLSGTGRPVGVELAGDVHDSPWVPAERNKETTSYYVGRDASRFAKDVPHYGRITRRDVYPGIDLAYYGNQDRLEYDFLLAPQADPKLIRLHFTGVDATALAADGALVLTTATGTVRQEKPVFWQKMRDGVTRPIDGNFRLLPNHDAAFQVGSYDPSLPLSIDPVLSYSSYFGGSADDKVVFTNGAGLTVGSTSSIDVPGANFARRQGVDIFWRNGPNTVVVGGSGDDQVTTVSVSSTFLVIGGFTNSTDLPTGQLFLSGSTFNRQPASFWQKDFAGGASDGFLLALDLTINSSYGALLTYYGTEGDDRITGVSYAGNRFAAVGYTNGTSLPQPLVPSYRPAQPSSAGGVDGFLLAGTLNFANGASLIVSTYLGGSGDDMPQSVYVYNSIYTSCYVTGTTSSPDFPLVNPLQGTRSGGSDAFLVEYKPAADGSLGVAASTLFGGNGTDRGDSIVLLSNLNVVVGGTTSSTDLPMVNPWKGVYSGGDTDAFLAQFSPDLSTVLFSTYAGGSGHEETTAVATDYSNNVLWAGWTNSSDFPTGNPIQPGFGGGPDDGFYIEIAPDHSIPLASYFGGSGSDRILGALFYSGNLWIAGQTTSGDLPLQKADQSSLKGASDGFIASVTPDGGILPPSITGGKGGRTFVSALTGPQALTVTVTSSDPSKVLVAGNSDDPGQATATFPTNGSVTYFYVDCLDDHSSATVTLTTESSPARTSTVTCYPLRLLAASSFQTIAWNPQSYSTYVELVAGDPAAGTLVVPDLQPGSDPVVVQIANSNPAAGTVSPSTVTFSHGHDYSNVSFAALAPGQTDLTLTADALGAAATAVTHVTVGSPIRVSSRLTIPQGFQLGAVSPGINLPPSVPSTITVTSADPSRVAVSSDPKQAGGASVSISANLQTVVYVQALDNSGDVILTSSLPGSPDVTTTVHLTPPVATLSGNGIIGPPTVVGVGQKASFSPILGGADLNSFNSNYLPNPGAQPQAYTLTTSDPTIATVSPASILVLGTPFQVTGVTAGTTQLILHPPDGVALAPFVPTVKVKSVSAGFSSPEVGKDLQTTMTLTLPAPPTSATSIKITSSNPAAVLLSLDSSLPGQAQVVSSLAAGNTTLIFNVYGLASDGQVTLTADIQGLPSVTGTVTLDPSGFGWDRDSYSTILYASPSLPSNVSLFALDHASLLPVSSQRLRPGMSESVPLTNQNPAIASLNIQAVPIASTGSSLSLTPLSAGTTTIGIIQPPGFAAPSIRTQLAVTVTTPTINISASIVGKNTQTSFPIGNIPPADLPLTLSSSDPSKLVFSSNPTVLGSGKITVSGSARQQLYAQGLDSSGLVTVTASMPTFADTTTTIGLVPAGFGLAVQPGNTATLVNGIVQTTTQSAKTELDLQLLISSSPNNYTPAQLLPGLGPVSVTVTSSNPSAGTIDRTPVSYSTGPQSVNFVPAAVGDTDVTVVQPAGFSTFPTLVSKQSFHVMAPSLTANDWLMGKDTIVLTSVGLLSTVQQQAKNVAVTLTSSDPSSVLLSLDSSTPATATVTGILVAGTRSLQLYVHALQNTGVIPVMMTAPGFQDGSFKVTLTDTDFVFYNSINGPGQIPLRSVLQAGPQTRQIYASIPQASTIFGINTSGQATIRPGAQDIVLDVTTTDSGTVAVDAPRVVFKAGSNSASFTFRPVQPGSATLGLSVPAGYVTDPSASQLPITVQAARLSFNASAQTLGRDLQAGVSFSSEVPFLQATPITVTSSDPSRLLVSADTKTPGQGSITLTPGVNQVFGGVNLQALGSDGTVSVAISADGYQSASFPVTLAPSAAVFNISGPQNVLTTAAPQQLGVGLATLDPVTLIGPCCYAGASIRPGAMLSTTVTSSDPTVLVSDTSSISFSNTDGGNVTTIKVRPVSAGTAILSRPPGRPTCCIHRCAAGIQRRRARLFDAGIKHRKGHSGCGTNPIGCRGADAHIGLLCNHRRQRHLYSPDRVKPNRTQRHKP